MRAALMAILAVLAMVAIPAPASHAQATPECLQQFPGAAGRSCCNASFARRPRGTQSGKERMTELRACVARAGKKGQTRR